MRPLTALLSLALLLASATPGVAEEPVVEETLAACEEVFDEGCPSHASGGRPEFGPHIVGNPTHVVTVLRVGLRSTTFRPDGSVLTEQASHDHAFATVTGTAGDFHVVDLGTGRKIVSPSAGQEVRVSFSSATATYDVGLDGAVVANVTGPVRFRAGDPANTFKVTSLRRSNWTSLTTRANGIAEYRGEIEVTRLDAPAGENPALYTPANMLNVVNLVPLEQYVRGVVPNESVVTFHREALRAQAITARGYALANKDSARFRRPYGIDDTTASQVYRGKGSEHPNTDPAVAETESLVATYNGRIISALYSSSMGGFTENNEWIFNSPSTSLPGTNAEPYLRGIYDGEGERPDPRDPAFWHSTTGPTATPAQLYDGCPRVNNRFSRWNVDIDAAALKTRALAAGRSVVTGNTTGTVSGVQITQRMPSSDRAAIVRITFTSGGIAEVRGWDNVRRVVGTSQAGKPWTCTAPSTIAGSFVLNNPNTIRENRDATGKLLSITSWGGGWGHNVGMSQFGSHGRGLAGQNVIQILNAYYTGIDVAAYPIDVTLDGGGPRAMKQHFSNITGTAWLRITATGMQGLRVHVNDACDLRYGEAELASPVVADVSACLVNGRNVVQYNPIGTTGSARVLVAVE